MSVTFYWHGYFILFLLQKAIAYAQLCCKYPSARHCRDSYVRRIFVRLVFPPKLDVCGARYLAFVFRHRKRFSCYPIFSCRTEKQIGSGGLTDFSLFSIKSLHTESGCFAFMREYVGVGVPQNEQSWKRSKTLVQCGCLKALLNHQLSAECAKFCLK